MILYLGLGRMGLPMATHALHAGHDVTGFDPSHERRALWASAGGTVASHPSSALEQADTIVLMVGSDSQVLEIVTGTGGILERAQPGTLIIVSSTVSPHFLEELEARVRASQMRLVDAPVCRAEMGAIEGKLLAFLAGEPADCQQAATVMAPYCADIERIGTRVGAAQVAKTVNNLILWACAIANEEGLRLAASWQMDTVVLRRALVTSSADNWCLRHWERIGQMPWSIKDMEIALDTAKASGVDIPLSHAVAHLVRTMPLLSHATSASTLLTAPW
jgi:3-hydroxyisobutyrate dehydrogenase